MRAKNRTILKSKLPRESKLPDTQINRIVKAKRSIQSNEDKTSSQGKLQISGSLFPCNVTEAAGKNEDNN